MATHRTTSTKTSKKSVSHKIKALAKKSSPKKIADGLAKSLMAIRHKMKEIGNSLRLVTKTTNGRKKHNK